MELLRLRMGYCIHQQGQALQRTRRTAQRPQVFCNELKYLPHKVRLLGLGAPQTLQAIRLRRAKERRRARELSHQLMRQLSATSSSTGGANDSDSDSDGGSSDVELEFEGDGDEDEDEDALACAEKGNAKGGDVDKEDEDEEDVWRDHGHEGESSGSGVSAKAKSGGTTKSGKIRVKGLSIERSNTPPSRRARLSQAARRSLTAASTWATHLARDPIGTLSYNALTMRDSIASKLSGGKAGDGKAKQQRPQPEAANSLSWLDLLDVAVAELGFSKLPVINDLFIHMALKSFSKHGIVSERTLHTALVPYAGASGPGREKFALLIAALELDGVFYEHVLGSFFETSWGRFEELGKGANYDWPLEEDKARETVLAAEGTVGGKDTSTGTGTGTGAGTAAGTTGKASEGHETTIVDDIPPSAELALLYPMAFDNIPQRESQAPSSLPTDTVAAAAAAAAAGSGSPAAQSPSDNGILGIAASLLQWRRSTKRNTAAAAAAAAVVAEEASASTQSAEAPRQHIETETTFEKPVTLKTTFHVEGGGL